jgi:peptidyl-prolyl cis-trans isomerase A (cyclophilin A)
MRLLTTLPLLLALALAAPLAAAPAKSAKTKPAPLPKTAVLVTTKGDIVVKLFPDKAPKTVANFVGLARGTKEWIDPETGKPGKGSYYVNVPIHRVIPGFMMQSGDRTGTGRGGPGYTFEDEFSPSLRFDKPGKLAMANAGPGTNGSQFFITVAPTPHLNDRHTIFGEVVKGQQVAVAITEAPRDANDRPLTPITLKKIILR